MLNAARPPRHDAASAAVTASSTMRQSQHGKLSSAFAVAPTRRLLQAPRRAPGVLQRLPHLSCSQQGLLHRAMGRVWCGRSTGACRSSGQACHDHTLLTAARERGKRREPPRPQPAARPAANPRLAEEKARAASTLASSSPTRQPRLQRRPRFALVLGRRRHGVVKPRQRRSGGVLLLPVAQADDDTSSTAAFRREP